MMNIRTVDAIYSEKTIPVRVTINVSIRARIWSSSLTERRRVSAEETGSGSLETHSAHISTLVLLNSGSVVAVDDGRTHETAGSLAEPVDGQFLPAQLS